MRSCLDLQHKHSASQEQRDHYKAGCICIARSGGLPRSAVQQAQCMLSCTHKVRSSAVSETAPSALRLCCACRYVTVYGRTKTSANGKTHRQNVKIQRLVTPERLQRKRRRAAIKKGRITKVISRTSLSR